METVRRIQLAEDELADIQRSISTVQSGLQRMESAANAVAATWERWPRIVRIATALIIVSLLAYVLSARRADSENSGGSETPDFRQGTKGPPA